MNTTIRKLLCGLLSVILVLSLFGGLPAAPAEAAPPAIDWADETREYRMSLQYNRAAAVEDLQDFPILVKLNPERIIYDVTGPDDLRFYASDQQTELSYEVELWNPSGDSFIWVKVPYMAKQATGLIWLYFGGDAPVVNTPADVWSNQYLTVHHMAYEAAGITDSTANGHDGIATGSVAATADGLIGDAVAFQGGHIPIGYVGDDEEKITVSGWFKFSQADLNAIAPGVQPGLISRDLPGGDILDRGEVFMLRLYNKSTFVGNVLTTGGSGSDKTGGAVQTDQWYHVALTYDSTQSGENMKLYVNGIQTSSRAAQGKLNNGNGKDAPLVLGAYSNGNYPMHGIMDEMTIANDARSAEWIRTSFQSAKDELLTYGAVEDLSALSEIVELQLLSFNDFHGFFLPADGADGQLTTPQGTINVGGAAYFATHVKQLQAGHDQSLLVSLGDNFSGWQFDFGDGHHNEPMIELLNALKLDISTAGNHEFDISAEFLIDHMLAGNCFGEPGVDSCFTDSSGEPFHGSDFEMIAANVRTVDTNELILEPYVIKEISDNQGGVIPIGFIGLVPEDTMTDQMAFNPSLKVEPLLETANYYAQELQSLGVETIIALVHEGTYQNAGTYNSCAASPQGPIFDFAREASAAIDVILAGHTHNAYNCVVNDPDGNPRPVIEAGSYGKLITELNLSIDRTSKDVIRSKTVAVNHPVTRDVIADPEIEQMITYWTNRSTIRKAMPLAELTGDLTLERNEFGEAIFPNLIADAYYYSGQKSEDPADFAMVRSNLHYPLLYETDRPFDRDGFITFYELLRATGGPHHPTVVVSLTGDQVKQVVEQQWRVIAASGDESFHPLDFSQNIHYKYDSGKLPGNRVSLADFMIDGAPLEANKIYRVAITLAMALNGDGYTAVSNYTDPDRVSTWTMLDYIQANTVIEPPLLERVEAIYDQEATTYDWLDENRDYRMELKYSRTFATSDLVDFPVLVKLTADRINYEQTGPNDLRFFSGTGQASLVYEVDEWNPDGDSYVWVKVPMLKKRSSGSLWLYYGGAADEVEDDYNQSADVWDHNYLMVQHMKYDETTTITDSTTNGHSGQAIGTVAAESEGIVGQAISFTGGYIPLGYIGDGEEQITVSGWMKFSQADLDSFAGGSQVGLISRDLTGSDFLDRGEVFMMRLYDKRLFVGNVLSLSDRGSDLTGGPVSANRWYNVVVTYDSTQAGQNVKLYVNGVLANSRIASGVLNDGLNKQAPLVLGAHSDGAMPMRGMMDEVTIANSTRNAEWIQASYATVLDQLFTYGLAEVRETDDGGNGSNNGNGGSNSNGNGGWYETKPDTNHDGAKDQQDEEELPNDENTEVDANALVFNDLMGHWAEQKVEQAITLGIVKGYADGSFRPNGIITRAEFITMLGRALQFDYNNTQTIFPMADKMPLWAIGYAASAVDKGIITGFADGTYRPNQAITRTELAAIIVRALQLPLDDSFQLLFADANKIPTWGQPYVAAAVSAELLQGRERNKFAPNESLTRAEAVTVILNLLAK